ncbi:MAG: diguanylate cyclase [Desulfovibrionaceae bacterium]
MECGILQKVSVLYVEDELITREFVAAGLEPCVGRLLVADEGRAGLDIFFKERPDIIVADIRMPVMDGLAMIRALREAGEHVPVIITTFLDDTSSLKQSIELGVNGYALKPLETAALVKELAKCAAGVLAARELSEQRRFNELMLDSMPYPAMLYAKSSHTIIAANRKATDLELGKGAECCGPFFEESDSWDLSLERQDDGHFCLDEACAYGRNWDRIVVPVTEDIHLFFAVDVTEQHRVEMERERYLSILRATIESTANGIVVFSRDWELLAQNKRFRTIWGLPDNWADADSLVEALAPILAQVKDPERYRNNFSTMLDHPDMEEYDVVELADGRFIERHALPYREGGQVVGKLCSCLDITARKRMELGLRQAEETYRTIFESAAEGIFRTDAKGRFTKANPALARLLGYASASELMQSVPALATDFFVDADRRREFVGTLERENTLTHFDAEVRRKDGSHVWVSLSARVIRDGNGETQRYEGLAVDVTERLIRECELRRKASFDELTGLANRRQLDRALRQMLAQAKRVQGRFSVLYIDLDRFKQVNDQYGHHMGDELLRQVAERIVVRFRQSDTVARIGGDEFVVLLWNVGEESDARQLSDDLITTLCRPFELGNGVRCTIGASIGASFFPEHGEDPQLLLKRADAAMYKAKKDGCSTFRIFKE